MSQIVASWNLFHRNCATSSTVAAKITHTGVDRFKSFQSRIDRLQNFTDAAFEHVFRNVGLSVMGTDQSIVSRWLENRCAAKETRVSVNKGEVQVSNSNATAEAHLELIAIFS